MTYEADDAHRATIAQLARIEADHRAARRRGRREARAAGRRLRLPLLAPRPGRRGRPTP